MQSGGTVPQMKKMGDNFPLSFSFYLYETSVLANKFSRSMVEPFVLSDAIGQ